MYDCFTPGEPWLDTAGKPIQAHGFSVFYENGVYYWYGENKEFTRPFSSSYTWGIRCYASTDLYNWEDKGLIIQPEPDDPQSPLNPIYCIDRPHILRSPATGNYVAWIKVMAGLTSQFMCILQADSFLGPYRFVHRYYHPLGMDAGDFALYQEEATGKAYILFDRPHFELVTAELTPDYTGVTGAYSAHYQNCKPPYTREAPAAFRRGGSYYLFTSGTTGYYPNPTLTTRFSDFHGEYTALGSPHQNDATHTSFNSQISGVLRVEGKNDLYIALADRWLPRRKWSAQQRWMEHRYAWQFRNYAPDRSPRQTTSLTGKKQRCAVNTSRSRYVWLPIEWQGDTPLLRWQARWRLQDYQ